MKRSHSELGLPEIVARYARAYKIDPSDNKTIFPENAREKAYLDFYAAAGEEGAVIRKDGGLTFIHSEIAAQAKVVLTEAAEEASIALSDAVRKIYTD